MAVCELCGAKGQLSLVLIEGSQLMACGTCSRHGKVLRVPSAPRPAPRPVRHAVTEEVELVVTDYAKRIRAARERRGLSQKDFAKLIAERESLVSRMESGQYEPPLETARKLERALGIALVERQRAEASPVSSEKRKGAALTIGDVIQMKRS